MSLRFSSASTQSSNQEDRLKTLIGHAKEYGFVFPSSEIYDGLSATYDYGLGVMLDDVLAAGYAILCLLGVSPWM